MAYVVDERMKELAEDVEREKALKDVAEATAKEKSKIAAEAESKIAAAVKAQALAETKSEELELQLGGTELKLAEAQSLTTMLEGQLADSKAALEACENKWYNEGFADAENSAEPVIRQAHRLGFEEGWFAALQVLGVPEDSSLRDRSKIPFPSVPQTENPAPLVIDEEETSSMRELVNAIDSHAVPTDMEGTSHPHVGDRTGEDIQPPTPHADQHSQGDASSAHAAVV